MVKRIAVIGDYKAGEKSHELIGTAIAKLALQMPHRIEYCWIHSTNVEINKLDNYQGLWIAPGSPYSDSDKIIAAIHHARTHKIPTLLTCSGFQYLVIEYAGNCLKIKDANSQENNCPGSCNVISLLKESLYEKTEKLYIKDVDSKLYDIIGKSEFLGHYLCSYGVNPQYMNYFDDTELKIVASNDENRIRALELRNHPFFLGTLFIPQLDLTENETFKIVKGFLMHI
jgi:CTP synthase